MDILLGNHWYTGRIVEKLPNNTIVKIKIRPEEQNNNETITLDLQSNRISQQHSFTSKSSNSKIVIDSCSMINFCDCFDLLFQKEFKEKAFFFMARNHFLISSTFLNMCNCFYAVKGLSVLNIHLRN